MSVTPSAPPDADGAAVPPRRGLVGVLAQTFAGVKTFAAEAIFSAGLVATGVRAIGASLLLRSNLGATSADVCSVAGTSETDANTQLNSRLLEIATGIGGTKVVAHFFTKRSAYFGVVADNAYRVQVAAGAGMNGAAHVQCSAVQNLIQGDVDFVGPSFRVTGTSQVNQRGSDTSASPGNATVDRPTGKSAIAGGATTVTITNSLVASGDQVHITWHGDLGTQSKIPWVTTAAGSFTVNVGTAPAGAVAFCWTVSKRL